MKKIVLAVIFFGLFNFVPDLFAFDYSGSMTKGGITYTDYFIAKSSLSDKYIGIFYNAECYENHITNFDHQFCPLCSEGGYAWYGLNCNSSMDNCAYSNTFPAGYAYINSIFMDPSYNGNWVLNNYYTDWATSQDIYSSGGSHSLIIAHTYATFDLTVSASPEIGGVVTSNDEMIQCGREYENCYKYYIPDTEIDLTATPTTGYEFAYWEWNNGANSSTNNPETFTVDEDMEVMVVFRPVLEFPLYGTLGNRTIISGFSADWLESCGGEVKKHTGIDIEATVNESVYAAEAGEIKFIFEDTSEYHWGWCIVIEHYNSYTTTYWHLNDPRNAQIYTGATVTKGQGIGTIKSMSNTHLHLGVRIHAYTSDNIPNAGALPQTPNCGGYPGYPEYFIDPEDLTYE
jgi:hypothetical protein